MSINTALCKACRENRLDDARSLIAQAQVADRKACEWRFGFISACSNGNVELAKLMDNMMLADKGTRDNINVIGFRVAVELGHTNIMNFLIKQGVNDWNAGLQGACQGGHMELIELFINKGANSWNWGLFGAACNGHMNAVQLMIDKGANDWNTGLLHCLRGFLSFYDKPELDYKEIINLMIDKGADLELCIYRATMGLLYPYKERAINKIRTMLNSD